MKEFIEYLDSLNGSKELEHGIIVKTGNINKDEINPNHDNRIFSRQNNLKADNFEIRLSIRSSALPSIEIFTLRDLEPEDYKVVLLAIPRHKPKTKK